MADESSDTLASLQDPDKLRRRMPYAGSSGRELSTSAKKRQSVLALTSIKVGALPG